MNDTVFETVMCGGVEVSHAPHLDGGGPRTWPQFVATVRDRVGPVGCAFEWCAGPGYIGFALLGQGLCDQLVLADINPDAVAACQQTIARNGLEDRVRVYESDNLAHIPAHEQWDLVVGDPPHFLEALPRHIEQGFALRSVDSDWKLHRELFRTLPPHLAPGARVLLSESSVAGDNADLFTTMMEHAGLELVHHDPERGFNGRYLLLAKWIGSRGLGAT